MRHRAVGSPTRRSRPPLTRWVCRPTRRSLPPTLPASAAIARTVAAGVLLSAAALAVSATLVLLIVASRLMFAGDARLTFDALSRGLITVALAIAYAATLAAPIWPWPARRAATLALAAVFTAAWPVSASRSRPRSSPPR